MVIGAAQVRFSNKKIDTTEELTLLAPISEGAIAVEWDHAAEVDLPTSDLEQTAQYDAAVRGTARRSHPGEEL